MPGHADGDGCVPLATPPIVRGRATRAIAFVGAIVRIVLVPHRLCHGAIAWPVITLLRRSTVASQIQPNADRMVADGREAEALGAPRVVAPFTNQQTHRSPCLSGGPLLLHRARGAEQQSEQRCANATRQKRRLPNSADLVRRYQASPSCASARTFGLGSWWVMCATRFTRHRRSGRRRLAAPIRAADGRRTEPHPRVTEVEDSIVPSRRGRPGTATEPNVPRTGTVTAFRRSMSVATRPLGSHRSRSILFLG
jgi:hypothetical protein